jgi:hypothetical protein
VRVCSCGEGCSGCCACPPLLFDSVFCLGMVWAVLAGDAMRVQCGRAAAKRGGLLLLCASDELQGIACGGVLYNASGGCMYVTPPVGWAAEQTQPTATLCDASNPSS